MPIPTRPTLRAHTWIRMLGVSALVVLFLVLAVVCLVLPFQRTSAFGETSITAEADTFIDGNEPNKSFGDAPFINIKNNPPAAALLRFNVSGVAQNGPSNAHLQLFVLASKTNAAVQFNVFRVASVWDEHNLTWNGQPAFGDQLGASGVAPVGEGQWIDIDLGTAVSSDGVYSFAITSDAPDVVSFAAHTEANAPQLVLGPQEPTAEPTSALEEQTATPTEEATTMSTEATPTEEATDSATDATPSPTESATTELTSTPIDPAAPSTEEPTSTPTLADAADNTTAALRSAPVQANYMVYLPVVGNEVK